MSALSVCPAHWTWHKMETADGPLTGTQYNATWETLSSNTPFRAAWLPMSKWQSQTPGGASPPPFCCSCVLLSYKAVSEAPPAQNFDIGLLCSVSLACCIQCLLHDDTLVVCSARAFTSTTFPYIFGCIVSYCSIIRHIPRHLSRRLYTFDMLGVTNS